jgi:RNA:NAD 2'-phosphotransferase (TPT1/KptA family)
MQTQHEITIFDSDILILMQLLKTNNSFLPRSIDGWFKTEDVTKYLKKTSRNFNANADKFHDMLDQLSSTNVIEVSDNKEQIRITMGLRTSGVGSYTLLNADQIPEFLYKFISNDKIRIAIKIGKLSHTKRMAFYPTTDLAICNRNDKYSAQICSFVRIHAQKMYKSGIRFYRLNGEIILNDIPNEFIDFPEHLLHNFAHTNNSM